ncbi:ACT domain-containing protein [Rhizobium sp. KDH_Rht_773_N]
MTGITDLSVLLATMEPELVEGEFVYCTVPASQLEDHLHLHPLGLFRETEGLTLILPRDAANRAGLQASAPLRQITLKVHSSLEAVGLTAAFSRALTEAGISANVVAAYYHDHIFVPATDAERAIEALRQLSAASRS